MASEHLALEINNVMLMNDQPVESLEQRNSSSDVSLRFHQPVKLYLKTKELMKFEDSSTLLEYQFVSTSIMNQILTELAPTN